MHMWRIYASRYSANFPDEDSRLRIPVALQRMMMMNASRGSDKCVARGIMAYRNRLIANAVFETLNAVLEIAGSYVSFQTDTHRSLSNVTNNLVEVEKAMKVVNVLLTLVVSHHRSG
ncbi:hypothetical protein GOP47_0002612 [Adiantum capillus-veneris]|uniref:Uncharacterized protein n=1 Tax=Adiantum capillus-veneris TaxID=13818 RepID=A0A9D4ZPC0_ADICA|nr:hypothetical protein GOP47_0002612 [Adiantum capillus-veneris]